MSEHIVYDPNDDDVCYWVAWRKEDNLDVIHDINRQILRFRVFRDERIKPHGEPITEPMSRQEAYKVLRQLELLMKGANNERGTEASQGQDQLDA